MKQAGTLIVLIAVATGFNIYAQMDDLSVFDNTVASAA